MIRGAPWASSEGVEVHFPLSIRSSILTFSFCCSFCLRVVDVICGLFVSYLSVSACEFIVSPQVEAVLLFVMTARVAFVCVLDIGVTFSALSTDLPGYLKSHN